jgi:tetratricopeptide (TPR) repeat protein
MSAFAPQPLTFGDLLREYRVAAGLTQNELFEKSGISARAISALECGVNKRPQRHTVEKLADALDLHDAQRARFMAARRLANRPTPPLGDATSAPSSLHLAWLVGRGLQQARIAEWLEGDGPPLLLLADEPGIGKTRLLNDAVERATRAGWAVLRGASHESSRRSPYSPLLDALASAFDATASNERSQLLQGCGWLARLLPELAESVVVPAPAWELPPEQERRLMFEAAARFLHRLARPAGALLALDDLQWATPDGLDLLTTLLRSPAEPGGRGPRVVATMRDESPRGDSPLASRLAELRHEGLLETMRLGPLDGENAAALLRAALGSSAPDALLQGIIARAGGVPLFLLSLAQEAAAQPSTTPDALPTPASVIELVQWRVSQLPAATADILAVIAIHNAETPLALLLAASDHGERQTIAAIEAACAARLLSETPDGACVFHHDLYREAILATLSVARQRALHHRIAVALEADPRPARTAPLAFHYAQSAENGRALYFLERNGDELLAVRAYVAAESCYRDALERVDASADRGATGRLWDKLGALFFDSGKYADAMAAFERASAFYEDTGDQDGAALAESKLAWAHVKGGTGELGLPRVQRWLEAESLADLTPLTRAALWRAHAILLFGQNDYYEQLASAQRATAIARNTSSPGAQRALAQSLRLEGLALTLLGWYDMALPVLDETLALAKEVRDLDSYSAALNDSAAVYRAKGDLLASKAHSAQSVSVAEDMGDPTAVAFLTASHGDDCFYLGDWPEAREQYEVALRAARTIGESWVAAYPLFSLGQLNLAEGREAEAMAMLDEALAYAARDHDRQASLSVQIALAGRDLARGAAASALARLQPLLDPTTADRDLIELLPCVGWAMLESSDSDDALTTVEQGCELAAATGSRLALVDGLTCLARAQARLCDWSAAERSLDDALELARKIAYPYAEARALSAYGELWAARADPARARVQFARAIAIFERLGESLYRERAERLLMALGREDAGADDDNARLG